MSITILKGKKNVSKAKIDFLIYEYKSVSKIFNNIYDYFPITFLLDLICNKDIKG